LTVIHNAVQQTFFQNGTNSGTGMHEDAVNTMLYTDSSVWAGRAFDAVGGLPEPRVTGFQVHHSYKVKGL
jgi:hypothetical protein